MRGVDLVAPRRGFDCRVDVRVAGAAEGLRIPVARPTPEVQVMPSMRTLRNLCVVGRE